MLFGSGLRYRLGLGPFQRGFPSRTHETQPMPLRSGEAWLSGKRKEYLPFVVGQRSHEAGQKWLCRIQLPYNSMRKVTVMKKFFSLFLLAMFLGIFAVGCGGPSAAPPESTVAEEHSADSDEHEAQTEHAAE